MLGNGRISIDIIFIHFASRFHSENDLKFERVTEYDFWFGVAAVTVLWPMQLFRCQPPRMSAKGRAVTYFKAVKSFITEN
jgi:hypothetical protein